MGKNKKKFPNRNTDKSSKKNSQKEESMKNAEDIKIEYRLLNENYSPFKIYSNNKEYNKVEERFNNKFDIKYQDSFYGLASKNSRKESRDSTNDSISYEDHFENDFYSGNLNFNNNQGNINNKYNQKNNQKIKKQGPFKSTASDFKIKYKTELCKYYEINGYCKYGDRCAYAHGKENLRSKVTNSTAYRTRKCVQFFENGYCPYGNRCQFAHQLTSNIINNPYDRKMTYKKTLETISKLENLENMKKLIEKPRLSIFKEIYPNKNLAKSTLFDDIKKINKEDIIERIDTN